MPANAFGATFPADRTASRRATILLTLCLGVLVAQVDTSVVNLAAQPIGASFHASVAALQWVLDAYNLTYAVLLLSGGLCADIFGRRLIFQTGAAVIALASIVCVLAPDIGVLIAARAATGVGAAMLLPASLAIVRVIWPDPAARRRALGVWASCNGLAFVIGPTLGGLLIGRFGWQSVFLLAVPLAAAAFVLARGFVPESADPKGRSLDIAGQVLGAAALGGLVFAVIAFREGGHAWIISLAVAMLATPLFLLVEHRTAAVALMPLGLFKGPAFRGAVVATAAMTFGIYGMIFLLPLVWQSSGRLTPQAAGLALLPCALLFFLISPRSGHLAHRIGVRASTAGGTAVIASGLLVLELHPPRRTIAMGEPGAWIDRRRHGDQHRAADVCRRRRGRGGACRDRGIGHQCRPYGRGHARCRGDGRDIRPVRRRAAGLASGDAARRCGSALRRRGRVGHDPLLIAPPASFNLARACARPSHRMDC